MRPDPRVRLDSLTSLRFVAAVIVVLSHTVKDLVAGVPALNILGAPGGVGVGFFFALSGFVLTWSHRPGDTAKRFYRRRFARVYPMHLVTFAAAAVILTFAGSHMATAGLSAGALLASPFLLQAWFPDAAVHFGMNAPSWSLSNEMFFYLLFPLLVPVIARFGARAVRLLLVVLPAVVLVGALAITLTSPVDSYYMLYVNPLWRLLGFVAGMTTARAVADGMRVIIGLRTALALAVGGYVVLIAILLYGWRFSLQPLATAGMSDAIMLPLFLLLIAAAARSDLEHRNRWLTRRPFVRLGEWSFSLYLTHWLLIDVVVGVAPQIRDLSPKAGVIANLLFIVLATALSAACYYLIEAPLERRLRGTRPRMSQVAAESVPTTPASDEASTGSSRTTARADVHHDSSTVGSGAGHPRSSPDRVRYPRSGDTLPG